MLCRSSRGRKPRKRKVRRIGLSGDQEAAVTQMPYRRMHQEKRTSLMSMETSRGSSLGRESVPRI